MALPRPTLVGNLTADPELRFAPNGMAVCTFTVACSSRKQVNGEWVDDKVLFMPVTVFKDPAEHAAESFRKGENVIVTGQIYTDSWTDKDGNKRSMIKMNADSIAVDIKYRIVPHGAGKTERSSARSDTGNDPWATGPEAAPVADNEPPF